MALRQFLRPRLLRDASKCLDRRWFGHVSTRRTVYTALSILGRFFGGKSEKRLPSRNERIPPEQVAQGAIRSLGDADPQGCSYTLGAEAV
jgi:hypothetical protein